MTLRRLVPLFATFALVLLLAACGGGGQKTTADAQTVEGELPQPGAVDGDATEGKALFVSKACGGCHTFAPAGTSSTIGPDLGNVAADAEEADRGTVAEYIRESLVDPDAYHTPGFSGGMPSFSSQLSAAEMANLVAFLTKS